MDNPVSFTAHTQNYDGNHKIECDTTTTRLCKHTIRKCIHKPVNSVISIMCFFNWYSVCVHAFIIKLI